MYSVSQRQTPTVVRTTRTLLFCLELHRPPVLFVAELERLGPLSAGEVTARWLRQSYRECLWL
jgi:hypothetical protein